MENEKPEKKCANCRWYWARNANQGECRTEPPKLFAAPSKLGNLEFLSKWPDVPNMGFCAKYEESETVGKAPDPLDVKLTVTQ